MTQRINSKSKSPAFDHTLSTPEGGYAQVVSPVCDAKISHIISREVATDPVKAQYMCLKFWAYFSIASFDNDIFFINLYQSDVLKKTVLTLNPKRSIQDKWIHLRTTFHGAYNDKISIFGNTLFKNDVIAIDDINIIGRKCEPAGWCDFESG